MNITLTIPDSAAPAWNARLAQFNAGSGQPPVTLQELKQIELDEETTSHVSVLKTAQREALIPVADQILAASPEKQQAAIDAALAAIA